MSTEVIPINPPAVVAPDPISQEIPDITEPNPIAVPGAAAPVAPDTIPPGLTLPDPAQPVPVPVFVQEASQDGKTYGRKNAGWEEIVSGPQGEPGSSGIPDAPSDGKQYARKDAAWAEVAGDGNGIPDAPSDGKQYARKNAAWDEVVSSGGGSSISTPLIAYVETTGSDATGEVGNPAKPFLTPRAAVDALGVNTGVVKLGVGLFTLTGNLDIGNQITFEGAGSQVTTLSATAASGQDATLAWSLTSYNAITGLTPSTEYEVILNGVYNSNPIPLDVGHPYLTTDEAGVLTSEALGVALGNPNSRNDTHGIYYTDFSITVGGTDYAQGTTVAGLSPTPGQNLVLFAESLTLVATGGNGGNGIAMVPLYADSCEQGIFGVTGMGDLVVYAAPGSTGFTGVINLTYPQVQLTNTAIASFAAPISANWTPVDVCNDGAAAATNSFTGYGTSANGALSTNRILPVS